MCQRADTSPTKLLKFDELYSFVSIIDGKVIVVCGGCIDFFP